MKNWKFFLALTMSSTMGLAEAGIALKAGPITEIYAESSSRPGYENAVYVKQPGTWSATDCPNPYSYFNVKDNPHFMSILLAAKFAEIDVNIRVESSSPRVGGHCQILNISID